MERFQGHINPSFAEAQSFAFKEEEEEESMQDTVPFLQMLQSEEDPLPFTSFKELLSLQNLQHHWELESYLSHNETNPVSTSSMEVTRQALSSQELPFSRQQDMTVPSSSSTPNSRRKRKTISNPPEVTRGKRKRRKTKPSKDIEEIENQRINHIAVERNRRRQMNEHISSLRSLLPPSYIQRGDQASIVGGAINYAKVLEQVIQSLELQRRTKQSCGVENRVTCVPRIEATLIQNHVNLKVECRKKQGQLLKGIVSLEKLRLTVLHLNISSLSCSSVSYCFNLKVTYFFIFINKLLNAIFNDISLEQMEDDCKLESAEEITKVAHQIFDT
ncbi:transcription factor bHLH67-like isoform X1 [Brassica napus]|uniref:transcription factor bHLH67-like isoform X1 n=1 Tax=Brassica napus TaxID=3708 RepID=UPI000BBEA856|nr:transcription factor bHLH67-like isoform X1 [Brassica napus]